MRTCRRCTFRKCELSQTCLMQPPSWTHSIDPARPRLWRLRPLTARTLRIPPATSTTPTATAALLGTAPWATKGRQLATARAGRTTTSASRPGIGQERNRRRARAGGPVVVRAALLLPPPTPSRHRCGPTAPAPCPHTTTISRAAHHAPRNSLLLLRLLLLLLFLT